MKNSLRESYFFPIYKVPIDTYEAGRVNVGALDR